MKKITFAVIGWLVSIGLLIALAWSWDWAKTWASLSATNYWFLTIAILLNFIVVALKSVRWQWLLTDKKTHFKTMFKAQVIGMAGNNIMPARGGDWYRIYLLGKWEKISKAALTSITGLDKLFDGIAILALFAITSMHSTFPEWVRSSTLIVTGVIIGGLIICILFRIHHKRNIDIPHTRRGKISQLIYQLGAGMSIMEEKGKFGATLVLSFVVALLQISTLLAVQKAFGIILPVWVPVLVYVAINLAIIVPSAPSNIGPFEVAAVLAYTWQGLTKEVAFNVAFIYHVVQVLPVTVLGAYYYLTTFRHHRPKASKRASTSSA